MGIKLIVEVMDHAPPELTASERWLLACLAEQARDETRICYPGKTLLMERMRTDRWDTVATVFRSLAAKGYEVRESRGVGRDGRAVVATKGRQTTYRVPEFPCSGSVRANADRTSHEVTKG